MVEVKMGPVHVGPCRWIDGMPLDSSSRGMGESEYTNGQWPYHV